MARGGADVVAVGYDSWSWLVPRYCLILVVIVVFVVMLVAVVVVAVVIVVVYLSRRQ